MQSLIASLRIVLATIAICVVGYTALILGFAQLVTPDTANGSLITNADGTLIGSRLIAQGFTRVEYFWPRPSAVDYDGAAAGGSNKSPTSAALTERAGTLIARHGATVENPLPPELVTASGGGLDPHISERAARYQSERVANARGVPQQRIDELIATLAFAPGQPLTANRIVNVLQLNVALDSLDSVRSSSSRSGTAGRAGLGIRDR